MAGAPPIAGAGRAMLAAAETAYTREDWATALPLYRTFAALHPDAAEKILIPLALGHCEIELGMGFDPTRPARLHDPDHDLARARFLAARTRALTLLRAGDAVRASDLLRLLAGYDPVFADVYARDMRGVAPSWPAVPAEPPFVATIPDVDAIERIKARCRGLRVLLVVRRFYRDDPTRQYQIVDNLVRSAGRFGLAVREFSSWTPPPGVAVADYAAALRAEIETGAPRLIVFDDLFERGLSVEPTVGPQLASLLATVRRRDGIRVVKMLPDAWLVPPERFHRGLGEHYDLLNHVHPAALGRGDNAERAATFCFPFPFAQPTPTAPTHGVARACFVGTVNAECPGRLVWWAEAVRAGVPLDVFLTDHGGPVQRSDLDYVNLLHGYQLSVNLTRRHTGMRIITGRSIETPLSGGLLLEEDSEDTRYFMTPGAHYEPFDTLDHLVARVPGLLAEPDHCRRVAAAGEAWVKRYFSGDYFWTAVLDRLGLA